MGPTVQSPVMPVTPPAADPPAPPAPAPPPPTREGIYRRNMAKCNTGIAGELVLVKRDPSRPDRWVVTYSLDIIGRSYNEPSQTSSIELLLREGYWTYAGLNVEDGL